jgi:uncharacterized protein
MQNEIQPVRRRKLRFTFLRDFFAICRLPADAPAPSWSLIGPFTSVTPTGDEVSIVCPAENVPEGVQAEKPWVCFMLTGPFPFSETGILASFLQPLADRKIPIFAIATYDTDYVLVKREVAQAAFQALLDAGHEASPAERPWERA